MGNPITLLKGLGFGAGLMYLFDPERGARRRALLADKATCLVNDLTDAVSGGAQDLKHRTYGLAAEARSRLTPDEADDRVICDRVRSRMGREVSNPRAIMVGCHQGVVTLRGPILASEVDRLLTSVARTRGVTEVIDRLEVHQQPGNIPALQGAGGRRGSLPEWSQGQWSPATKLMLGTTGAIAGLAIIRRSGLTLPVLGMAGAVWALSRVEGDPLAAIPGWGQREEGWGSAGVDRGRGGLSGGESGTANLPLPADQVTRTESFLQ